MNWLLHFLRDYLFPGIDDLDVTPPTEDETPAEDETVEEGDPPADDADEPSDEAEDHPGDSEEDPAPRETRGQKAIRETRERAQKAERELATARAELEAARRPQQSGTQQPTPDQVLWQQEEETLRNPELSDWQRYAINSARGARQAQAASQQALAQAQDMADRTAFQAIATTKPKTFEAYKDRVEAKVQELRARGVNVPRDVILKTMLGEDMLAGKLKTPEKVKPSNGAAPRRAPRSDVATGSPGGRMSDAERRAKRLENVRI
jgi:hypothetical protein